MRRREIALTIVAAVVTLNLYAGVKNGAQSFGTIDQPSPIAASTEPKKETPTWRCPHPSQIQLTPVGQDDAICVYRGGSVGQKLRENVHDRYTVIRKELKKEGLTPSEIEAQLYAMDLEIMQNITEGS